MDRFYDISKDNVFVLYVLFVLYFKKFISKVRDMEGWDRYRLGHPAVEVLAEAPRLNVQSGHSKVLHQGSSCAALGPHP